MRTDLLAKPQTVTWSQGHKATVALKQPLFDKNSDAPQSDHNNLENGIQAVIRTFW